MMGWMQSPSASRSVCLSPALTSHTRIPSDSWMRKADVERHQLTRLMCMNGKRVVVSSPWRGGGRCSVTPCVPAGQSCYCPMKTPGRYKVHTQTRVRSLNENTKYLWAFTCFDRVNVTALCQQQVYFHAYFWILIGHCGVRVINIYPLLSFAWSRHCWSMLLSF